MAATKGKPGIKVPRNVGLWMKYRLKLQGYTMSKLSKEWGCRDCMVSLVLCGHRSSDRLLKACCKLLGYLTYDELLADIKEKGILS